jgi:aspartyl-tRNA(Asn)/glutamyl-tRNA(Gln) amidotransferase subunit C
MNLDEVRKVAKLARLELTEADLVRMTQQLTGILAYVDQLAELNTEGVEPMAHPLPVHNIFRPDEPQPSLGVDAALANAPKRIGSYFGVPAVLEAGDESH